MNELKVIRHSGFEITLVIIACIAGAVAVAGMAMINWYGIIAQIKAAPGMTALLAGVTACFFGVAAYAYHHARAVEMDSLKIHDLSEKIGEKISAAKDRLERQSD